MSDITERAKALWAPPRGPVADLANLVPELVAEVERLRGVPAEMVGFHAGESCGDYTLAQVIENRNEVLDDLIERMERADSDLTGTAARVTGEDTASRLDRANLLGHASGFRQALSYVREARNG